MVRKKDKVTPAASRESSVQDPEEILEASGTDGDPPGVGDVPGISMYEELHGKIDSLAQQVSTLVTAMGAVREENVALRVRVETHLTPQTDPVPTRSSSPIVPGAQEGPTPNLPTRLASGPSESRLGPSPGADSSPTSMVQYVVKKESIHIFKADTPASQPLKRNQEVERWLRAIEMLTQPNSDQQLIYAAKTHCSGPADLLINSTLFDHVTSWGTFKAMIREKFRGTCTWQEFNRVITGMRLKYDQAPLDFFLEIEGFIYQGVRDYPRMLSDPEDTIKHVFLEGLPPRLRDFVRAREDDRVKVLVELAQRVWDAKRQEESEASYGAPGGMARRGQQFPEARHRQVAASQWCRFHKSSGHDTSECMVGRVICRICRRVGHFARECTFQGAQVEEEAPAPPGTGPNGAPEQWPQPQRSSRRQ